MEVLGRKDRFYEIEGDNLEMLKVSLQDDTPVFSEAGKMVYLRGDVYMETKATSPGEEDKGLWDKVVSAGKRVLAGESLFLTYFTGSGEVGFAGDYPGRILPVRLSGNTIYTQKDAFLAGMGSLNIGIALQKRIGGALFGGEGFILEKISGDGVVFLHAGGDLITLTLSEDEVMRVDTGCAVAWEEGVDYSVELVKGIKTALFGGEGLFLTTLSGPGTVVIQTMPLSKLRRQLGGFGGREKSENPFSRLALPGIIGGVLGGLLGGGDED